MESKRKVNINSVGYEEKEILLFLEKNGKCLYGNIFKGLKLSQMKGAEAMLSLISKKYVTNVGKSSFYELNVELVK